MTARHASAFMMVFAAATAGFGCRVDRPGVALVAFILALAPILSIQGAFAFWTSAKGEKWSPMIFAIQAMAADTVVLVALSAGTSDAFLISFRLVSAMIQIGTVGKLKRDHKNDPPQP